MGRQYGRTLVAPVKPRIHECCGFIEVLSLHVRSGFNQQTQAVRTLLDAQHNHVFLHLCTNIYEIN